MCGLFGYSLEPSVYDKDKARILGSVLAYASTQRGTDSWGLVSINKNEYKIDKGVGPINKGAQYSLFSNETVFGHTRHATMGAVTAENAHPFEMTRIVGMHNGIIDNWKDLGEYYKEEYNVDSQYLLVQIDKNRPVNYVSGNGAVVYINRNDSKRIYICVGSISDMDVVVLGDRTKKPLGVIWASKFQYIQQAMAISQYDDIEHVSIEIVPKKQYCVYKYEIYDSEEFDLSSMGKSPNKKEHKYSYPGNGYNWSGHEGGYRPGCGGRDYSNDDWKKKLDARNAALTELTSDIPKDDEAVVTIPVEPKKSLIVNIGDCVNKIGNKSKKKILRYEQLPEPQVKKLLRNLTAVLGVEVTIGWLRFMKRVLQRKIEEQIIGFKTGPSQVLLLPGGSAPVVSSNTCSEVESNIKGCDITVGPGGITMLQKNLLQPSEASLTREGGEYYDGQDWTGDYQ